MPKTQLRSSFYLKVTLNAFIEGIYMGYIEEAGSAELANSLVRISEIRTDNFRGYLFTHQKSDALYLASLESDFLVNYSRCISNCILPHYIYVSIDDTDIYTPRFIHIV
jgi:hypothetical protein